MILIIIGISNLVLIVLIFVFFSFFFVKVFFFNFTLCFLICIDNVFRFDPYTFNFCLLSLWLSILSFIIFFFNDNNDSNLIYLLLNFFIVSLSHFNFFIYNFQVYHSNQVHGFYFSKKNK